MARKVLPSCSEFSGQAVAALFLLLEKIKGEASFYWPYINILPKIIKTALFFDHHDLTFIQNTNLDSVIKERKNKLVAEYQGLLNKLPGTIDKSKVTWEEFLWSYCVFSSRSFPYTLIDPDTESQSAQVLFPLADALNHKPNTKITWSRQGDSETGSLTFISGEVYHAGDEIFNNYGPKSNEELLLGYGFCFEHNEHDFIALKTNFSQDPNQQIKLEILKQCQVSSDNADPFTFYLHRHIIPSAFFRMMRVLVMNNMETKFYSQCTDSSLLDFVGYRNEIMTLDTVISLLQSRLRVLQSVDLTGTDLTYWQKYALMYRQGQEDVFESSIKRVKEMKRILIQRMKQDKDEHHIAPLAPFLSIVNPSHTFSAIDIDSDSSFLTLDQVVITLQTILKKNPELEAVVNENFDNLDAERDIVMMLGLIKENTKPKSQWREFFDRVTERAVSDNDLENIEDEVLGDIQEMYESMIPAFVEAYPTVFDAEVYTVEAFVWADYVINNYSLPAYLFAV
ncbi:hypothetical protein CU098_001171, partial [Rhizopus stolonifer]